MLSALRLTLVAVAITTAAASCPSSEWKQFRDKCFWMSSASLHWQDVPYVCSTVYPNATMASIRDTEENTFIAEEVAVRPDGTQTWTWIGLSRANSTAPWTWTDGSPYNFSMWYQNDPEYHGGNCAQTNVYEWSMWASYSCSDPRAHFICQIPSF